MNYTLAILMNSQMFPEVVFNLVSLVEQLIVLLIEQALGLAFFKLKLLVKVL
jgi:hypothetical protein